MNITEAIQQRRSVRNYRPQLLSAADIQLLEKATANAFSPFGGSVEIRLRQFDIKGAFKPGTYGIIRGASSYLLMAAAGDNASAISAGFMMEQAVLAATAAGLGTCWIGGTFKETDFDRNENWPEGCRLKIVVPVGYPAERETFVGRITKLIARSTSRKPFGSLFFKHNFDTPLEEDSPFGFPLAMMRLAPSSVNSQPWRAVAAGDKVHFYTTSTAYMSLIDCGIGLCHFYLTLAQKEREGGRFEKDDAAPAPKSGLTYLTTFTQRSAE
ncbi:MAG: nitroreductase Nfs [Muribaculaceae bacterium]|nr:nitroreductase Nfs [Muribaculaceae bacterium]